MILKVFWLTIVGLMELMFAESLKADAQIIIALLRVQDGLFSTQMTIHGTRIVLIAIGWD